jgi:hypothetical protein
VEWLAIPFRESRELVRGYCWGGAGVFASKVKELVRVSGLRLCGLRAGRDLGGCGMGSAHGVGAFLRFMGEKR